MRFWSKDDLSSVTICISEMTQLASFPRLSSSRHLGLRSSRNRCSCVVNVQLPPSLDQALSARRINRPQVRALCELQQQEAEAALKIQQREAQIQERDAQIQQRDAQIELMRTDAMLTDRTAKLLFARGLLNVRGVLEWLEEEYAPKYSLQLQQKTEIWQAILADPVNKDLESCLVRATNKQKQNDKKIHLDIKETYAHASNHVHGKKSPGDHTRDSTHIYIVDIVEGPLLPKQAQIMICICKYFKFPYEFHKIQENLP